VVFLNAEPEKLERASNGLENRQSPASESHKIGVGKTGDALAGALSIGERYPVESGGHTACGAQNSIARRRIPFHRRAKARIDVGLSAGNQAKLQRRADGNAVADPVVAQEFFRFGVAVRAAADSDPLRPVDTHRYFTP